MLLIDLRVFLALDKVLFVVGWGQKGRFHYSYYTHTQLVRLQKQHIILFRLNMQNQTTYWAIPIIVIPTPSLIASKNSAEYYSGQTCNIDL